jgi:hypothetical protein
LTQRGWCLSSKARTPLLGTQLVSEQHPNQIRACFDSAIPISFASRTGDLVMNEGDNANRLGCPVPKGIQVRMENHDFT